MTTTYAIILAGGRGLRTGKELPKQFIKIGGRSVLSGSIETFQGLDIIDRIIIVVPVEYIDILDSHLDTGRFKKIADIVQGGETRQGSVYNSLTSREFDDNDILIFHDAARPFVKPETITRTVKAVREHGAAGTYIPAIDTIAEIESGLVKSITPRDRLFYTHTPQGFLYNIIMDSHRKALEKGIIDATDDVSLVIGAGYPVVRVESDYSNIKITSGEDLKIAGIIMETV